MLHHAAVMEWLLGSAQARADRATTAMADCGAWLAGARLRKSLSTFLSPRASGRTCKKARGQKRVWPPAPPS